MSRVWSVMDIGKRAMMNSQNALQTVSHNVANKDTEGYSRQRVELKSSPPAGLRLRYGQGAYTSAITRTNNAHLEKQIAGEMNKLATATAQGAALGRLEDVMNEQQESGVHKKVGNFFNAWRELSNNPENFALRQQVKDSAGEMTGAFKDLNENLGGILGDADFEIAVKIGEVNEITREIADLNQKIQQVELHAREANDERDRRDLLIKKLSGLVNISHAEGDGGIVTITAGRTAVLVSGYQQRELFVDKVADEEGKNPSMRVFYRSTKKGTPDDVTNQFTSGALGGLISVRDGVVGDLMNKVNLMGYTIVSEVNEAHRAGFDRYSGAGGDFFVMPDSIENFSNSIDINPYIRKDVGRIAAAAATHSPGDNRVANIISMLQYKKVFSDGTSSLDDFYGAMVGEVGILAAKANGGIEAIGSNLHNLEKLRESISGVSLDEEAAKMIEYQKAYDASARLIRTADEMMQTVLDLKRL